MLLFRLYGAKKRGKHYRKTSKQYEKAYSRLSPIS